MKVVALLVVIGCLWAGSEGQSRFPPYGGIDCSFPIGCFYDMTPWCIVGRSQPVMGNCALKTAICSQNAIVDETDSCLNGRYFASTL